MLQGVLRLAVLALVVERVAPQYSQDEGAASAPETAPAVPAPSDLAAPPGPPGPAAVRSQMSSPGPRNTLQYDAGYAAESRNDSLANTTTMFDNTSYTIEPVLARSTGTTSWLDRDRQRVMAGSDLYDDDAQLHQGNETLRMAGDTNERAVAAFMSRHGLYRRADDKFSEFVAQPTGRSDDGYGLWRVWESHGDCPIELLLADPWGSISWQAPPGPLRVIECSWVVRPGMYRHSGYFKLSRAPIVLSFRSFSLAAPHEVLDVYDGAHQDARLLGRFTGLKRPEQITSTNAEIRIVLSADLGTEAQQVWVELDTFLASGKLQ